MCHSDASYRHPFRRVATGVAALAVVTPAVLWLGAHLWMVLAVVAVLAVLAGAARVADVVGTRRAVARYRAHEAEHAAHRARQRALAAAPVADDVVRVRSSRPAQLEAAPPVVTAAWLADPAVPVPRAAEPRPATRAAARPSGRGTGHTS